MPTICLGAFSMTEAEALLAGIWLRLERNDEGTPRIRLKFQADGRIGVWVACPDPAVAAGCAAVAAGRDPAGAAA